MNKSKAKIHKNSNFSTPNSVYEILIEKKKLMQEKMEPSFNKIKVLELGFNMNK